MMTDTKNNMVRSALNRVVADLEEMGMKPFLTRMYPDGHLTIVLMGSTMEFPSFPTDVNSAENTVKP